MTISNETTFTGPLIANGVVKVFPFTFVAMGDSEVSAYGHDGGGTEIALPGFTVGLTGAPPSVGTVTFDTAPPDGTRIWIVSAPDFLQEIAFENGSRWLAGPVNEANDRAAVRALMLKRETDRSIKMPIGEAGVTLPPGSGPTLYTSVNTLAAISGDIESVAEVAQDVPIVAGRDTDIATVAARDADIEMVAARDADIGALADRTAQIDALAPREADLAALGPMAAEIEIAADNIAAIIAAPAAATAAEAAAADAAADAASLGATSALLRSFALAEDHAPPPSVKTETKGQTTEPVAAALACAWIVDDTTHAATFESYLTSVSVKHTTALVGRNVEVYIMRSVGGGNYGVIWASGLKAAASAGVTTVSIALSDDAIMEAGDVLGVWSSAATNADGISYATVSGTANRRSTTAPARLTVGSNYGATYTIATVLRPQISFTTISTTFFVTTDWIGAAHGVPEMDAAARVLPSNALFGGGDTLAAADTTMSIEGGKIYFRETDAVTTDSYPAASGTLGTFANTTATANIWYSATNLGLSRPGFLRELVIAKGSNIPASCKLQVALFRPRTPLPTANSATVVCDPVKAIGEFDLSAFGASTDAPEIRIPLRNTPCLQHDVLVVRGPNGFGYYFGAGHANYANDWQATATVSGSTLADLVVGPITFTAGTVRRRWIKSEVIIDASPLGNVDGPAAAPITDALGNLPIGVARAIDMPRRGKPVIITGTSIEIGEAADSPAPRSNHAWKLIDAMQALGYNEAVASSRIAKGFNISLAQTIAEATADYGPGFTQYSYENRIIARITSWIGSGGNPADVLWIDFHGFNDAAARALGSGLGETDPTTVYGAYNRIIAAFFAATSYKGRFVLCSPTHEYDTSGTGAVQAAGGGTATRDQIRLAKQTLAAAHNMPFVDVMKIAGINPTTIVAGSNPANGALPDGTHPWQVARDNIFRAVYAAAVAA